MLFPAAFLIGSLSLRLYDSNQPGTDLHQTLKNPVRAHHNGVGCKDQAVLHTSLQSNFFSCRLGIEIKQRVDWAHSSDTSDD